MPFLANENFPAAAIAALDAAGHNIVSVRLVAPGMSDLGILEWAIREQRVLLTFDKDFGELARMSGLPAACGVVLFRIPAPKPSDVGRQLAEVLASRPDWAGNFSVVEPGRIRMRRLA